MMTTKCTTKHQQLQVNVQLLEAVRSNDVGSTASAMERGANPLQHLPRGHILPCTGKNVLQNAIYCGGRLQCVRVMSQGLGSRTMRRYALDLLEHCCIAKRFEEFCIVFDTAFARAAKCLHGDPRYNRVMERIIASNDSAVLLEHLLLTCASPIVPACMCAAVANAVSKLASDYYCTDASLLRLKWLLLAIPAEMDFLSNATHPYSCYPTFQAISVLIASGFVPAGHCKNLFWREPLRCFDPRDEVHKRRLYDAADKERHFFHDARRRIDMGWCAAAKEHMLQICLALHHLPALLLCEIMRATGRCGRDAMPMHIPWRVATMVNTLLSAKTVFCEK